MSDDAERHADLRATSSRRNDRPACERRAAPFDGGGLAEVSVVVVTHNSNDVLQECLQSLPDDVEVIVVDNASSVVPTVARRFARSVVVRNKTNLGYGAAANVGVRAARRQDLILTNPDVRFEPGAIEALQSRRVAEGIDCVVGPSIWSPDRQLRRVCRRSSRIVIDVLSLLPYVGLRLPERLRYDLPPTHPIYTAGGHVDYLQGCCLLVSRAAFERVNGFDSDYFLYSEEEDLCARLLGAGVPSVYEPAARVVHIWGTSTGKERSLAIRHEFRSRLIFYRKHGGKTAAETYRCGALIAVGLHLMLLPIQHLRRRNPARNGEWCLAAIRGLAGDRS